MTYTYLLVNFFTILVPFLFTFHPRIRFHRTWRAFFPAALLAGMAFILWDAAFTAAGVWSFNPRYVTGLQLLGLPVEEWLFFLCIPYACVFTYFCLDRFWKLEWKQNREQVFCILFSAFLLTLGLVFNDRLYTSVTYISTAAVCLLMKFAGRIRWLGKAVTVYGVLVLPFLVVNGILTGTGLEEAVVRYNNAENLGIRIGTIPIEDLVYGFELFLLNLFFYHRFLERKPNKKGAGEIIAKREMMAEGKKH